MTSQRSWARRSTYAVSRILAQLAAIGLFRVRCFGRRNWPAEGGALVCANHQSFLDPVLVGLTCPRRMNYLARKSLFAAPGFRRLIRWYDAIPIEREGLGIGGLKETLRRLKRGELVLMFPEGTRTTAGELQPLHSGFCAVARRGRVPLVPVAIDGAYQAWPRDRRWPRRCTIRLCIGTPLAGEEIAELSDEQLVAELHRRLRECLEVAQGARVPRRRGRGGHRVDEAIRTGPRHRDPL